MVLNSLGGLDNVTDWVTSDFIEVLPETTISISRMSLMEYDVAGRFISGSYRDGTLASPQITFTTSKETKFIRVSVFKEHIESLQVEIGNATTTYETYVTPVIKRFNGESVFNWRMDCTKTYSNASNFKRWY